MRWLFALFAGLFVGLCFQLWYVGGVDMSVYADHVRFCDGKGWGVAYTAKDYFFVMRFRK